MDGTRACYAKGTKPGSKRQILYFLLRVESVGGGLDMDVEGLLGRREWESARAGEYGKYGKYG